MSKKTLLKQIEMFDEMLSNDISPNQYYLMCCIRDSISPGSIINIHLELRNLKSKGWLTDKNKLTPQGVTLVEKIERLFRLKKNVTSTQLMQKGYKENIERYREMFPKLKLPSGKPARQAVGNLEKAFRWFFENYEYDWETIFKATALYIDEYRQKNWMHMRTSQYFIRKDNNSDLADVCDLMLNGGYEVEQRNHKIKVV
jgi:hypothetical protein